VQTQHRSHAKRAVSVIGSCRRCRSRRRRHPARIPSSNCRRRTSSCTSSLRHTTYGSCRPSMLRCTPRPAGTARSSCRPRTRCCTSRRMRTRTRSCPRDTSSYKCCLPGSPARLRRLRHLRRPRLHLHRVRDRPARPPRYEAALRRPCKRRERARTEQRVEACTLRRTAWTRCRVTATDGRAAMPVMST
jgi:hypothetical protein